MVTLEEVLLNLSDRPLKKSTHSKVIHAVLKRQFPDDIDFTMETTGGDLLAEIYTLPWEQDKIDKLLNTRLGLNETDSYRHTLLLISVALAIILVFYGGMVLGADMLNKWLSVVDITGGFAHGQYIDYTG